MDSKSNPLLKLIPGTWYWWIQGERPVYLADTDDDAPELCFCDAPTIQDDGHPKFEPFTFRASELCSIIPGLDELDY